MAFIWTESKIKFFTDASEYTGFHAEIAESIKPHLNSDWSMCDMGCGLGYIDFQLAPCVKAIDAIDNSELAIDDYYKRLAASNIKNINLELTNTDGLSGREWDAILLSFYGRPGEALDHIFSMAKKSVIMLAYVEALPEGQGKLKKNTGRPTTSDMENYLIENNYDYEVIIKSIDFGQPFERIDDVTKYYESYTREEDPGKRTQQIEEVLASVKPLNDSKFSYYLPKKKDIGVFVVNK